MENNFVQNYNLDPLKLTQKYRVIEKMSSNLKTRLTELDISHGYMTGPPQINETMAAFKRSVANMLKYCRL